MDRECDVFCRSLVGSPAPPAVVEAYRRAHESGRLATTATLTARDRALLLLARSGPRAARLADSFAALFARQSELRRKLVLLVAILECRPETASKVDRVTVSRRARWYPEAAALGLLWAVRAVVATLSVSVLWLWCASLGRAAARDEGD